MEQQLKAVRKHVGLRLASRRFLRVSILAANFCLLIAVFWYISSSSQALQNQAFTATQTPGSSSTITNPLDQLSAADIAANVATATNLPETTAVIDQANSVSTELSIAPVSNTVVAQPQEVATSFKSRFDVQTYTVQSGDTIGSIAAKFNVTSNSIDWSNGLNGNSVNAGTKLLIPPVNGVVYTVKSGDSAQSIASKYGANQADLVAFNDAEINGFQTGEQIVIPNGQPPVAPAVSTGAFFAAASGSLSATYGGFGGCYYGGQTYSNFGYDCGYCTWWAAFQRAMHGDPVPSNLGEAYSWAYNAAAIGLAEGNTPKPGAVITMGSADHVAYVESVGADGSATISEMNREGWDIVDTRTLPASQADSYTYIY